MPETIVIAERFNGPPGTANGGYTCGLVAKALGEGPAEVSLRSPPPLGRPLAVETSRDGVELRDGDTLVAEGRLAELELEPPEAVALEVAEDASRAGFARWSAGHPFRTCVVCGPDRDPGDGFGIFPGELPGGGRFAAVWRPDPSLAENGTLPEECVWAALDCPTSAPVVNFGDGPACVLARLTARIEGAVEPERPYVAVSWPLEVDGRKRHSAAALFSADRDLVARSRALWIELRP
ncbi:MAG TPA: hypothetical protein VHG69_14030 [Thermoleophilaceae bacterium]|nr:hypothetical protein [Thermoleophilaceae bacterium]